MPVSKKSDKKKAHSRDEVLAPDALSRLEEDTGKSHRNGGSDDDATAAAEQQSKEDAEVESGSMSRRPGVSPIDQNRKKGKKKRSRLRLLTLNSRTNYRLMIQLKIKSTILRPQNQ